MTSKIRNTFIQAYIDSNKTLIKTLMIKSSYGIHAINKELILTHGENAVDLADPYSWKYYKNAAGEYHSTDTPMMIISLDTRQQIVFSADNLLRHTATAEGYRYGTRYYHALVSQYPTQEFLIHGILNPCPKAKAIAAENGVILSYPRSLVEESETTLIMELESFIKLFQARWDVQAFALTDPYYGTVQRALLGLQLLPKLLNLRLKRCKTDEVHTFHLREYLASHHELDRWLPYLTREQALWLYRNVCYLERNAGKVDNFNALLENLLNKRDIPVAEYTIRQFAQFDALGYPLLLARRKQIGKATPAANAPYVSLPSFYDKELKTTYGNQRFFDLNEQKMTHALSVSSSSVVQTKDLESDMVDLTDSVPDPLPDVLLRQWVGMTHQGLYNVAVNFQDPKTTETYSLLSRDAIIYMLYLTCKMEGIPFVKVPATSVVKFRLHPKPPLEELTRFIEPHMEELNAVVTDLWNQQPVLTECFSVSMFYETAYQLYNQCLKHWYLLARTHDVYARGVLEKIILKMFGSQLQDFSNGELVDVWRSRNNLPVFDRSYPEALKLIQEIFERATGYKLNETNKIRNVQLALISLFEAMSSYSIQFIVDVNDSRVVMLNGAALRVGDIEESVNDYARVKVGTHALRADGAIHDEIYSHGQLDDGVSGVLETRSDYILLDQLTDLSLSTSSPDSTASYHKANTFNIGIQLPDPDTGEMVPYPNLSLDKLLTQDQLKALTFVGQ